MIKVITEHRLWNLESDLEEARLAVGFHEKENARLRNRLEVLEPRAKEVEALRAEVAELRWQALLPYAKREELVKVLGREDPDAGLVRALRQVLVDNSEAAQREAAQPGMAGKPEATHALGGAYWLALAERALQDLIAEAKQARRDPARVAADRRRR